MNKHYEMIHKYDFLTKELLEQLYIEDNLTDQQIANKYNVSSKVIIWRKRKKFGIENKYKNKSNKHATINRKFNIDKKTAKRLLSENKTFEEISRLMGCSKIVAKRRFKELELTRKQIHTEKYKFYNIELNYIQEQLLIGGILGDGTLTTSGAYSCSHSIKQKEYFDYKRKVLSNLHSNNFQKYSHFFPKTNTETESLHFTTGCNKRLYELREIYYPNGKKKFPYDFALENLEPQGVAFWHMDDGGFFNSNIILYTYGYCFEDQQKIIKFFQIKFNLNPRINGKKERKYILRFPIQETRKFINLISPHIIPSMRYKIENLKTIKK